MSVAELTYLYLVTLQSICLNHFSTSREGKTYTVYLTVMNDIHLYDQYHTFACFPICMPYMRMVSQYLFCYMQLLYCLLSLTSRVIHVLSSIIFHFKYNFIINLINFSLYVDMLFYVFNCSCVTHSDMHLLNMQF